MKHLFLTKFGSFLSFHGTWTPKPLKFGHRVCSAELRFLDFFFRKYSWKSVLHMGKRQVSLSLHFVLELNSLIKDATPSGKTYFYTYFLRLLRTPLRYTRLSAYIWSRFSWFLFGQNSRPLFPIGKFFSGTFHHWLILRVIHQQQVNQLLSLGN